MAKRIYFFDFDDTLIDNRQVDLHSFRRLGARYGLQNMSAEQLLRWRKEGLIAKDILLRQGVPKHRVDVLVAKRKLLLCDDALWRHARLNPGVKKTLRTIARRGDRSFIVSRKSAALIRKIAVAKGIAAYIAGMYTSKRKSLFIRRFMKTYEGSTFFFIGDSEEELRSLRGLPVTTYCFYNKYKDKETLKKITVLITSMEEIL